jgi:HEPN domain-containing protein
MKMSTDNWLDFALDDLDAAEILLNERKYNMTCFHSQQAAEKALKGFLVHNKVVTPRTHNLVELINLCNKIDNSFTSFLPKMATLNQFYAPTRYPDAAIGVSPTGLPNKETAEKALNYAQEIVAYYRTILT